MRTCIRVPIYYTSITNGLLNHHIMNSRFEKIRMFKSLFVTYFEGCYDMDAVDPMLIKNFGISSLDFTFDDEEKMTVTISLSRPGLLIGKGGRTIDALLKYMKEGDICDKINLVEHDVFDFSRVKFKDLHWATNVIYWNHDRSELKLVDNTLENYSYYDGRVRFAGSYDECQGWMNDRLERRKSIESFNEDDVLESL